MKDRAVISIPSHPRFLSLIREVTVRMARMAGIENRTAYDLKLAVDEACANVIKHAYKGTTDRKITVKYRKTKKNFEVTIEDSGAKAGARALKGKKISKVCAGGLGVLLIKRAFDVCCFDEMKTTGNRLKLIKHLEAENED
jgi:serine/threonine-protein kinase RsbW